MKNGKQANDGGGSAASSEAAAQAADANEAVEDGSVNTLDEYLAGKDAGPGVSQQSDSEDVSEETEEEDLEESEGLEDEPEADSDGEDSEEEDDAEEEDEHDELDLDDDQKKAVGELISLKVGKQVAKRKAVEKQLEASESRVAELETELESAGDAPAVQGGPEPEVMFAESESEVDQFEADARSMQKQAKRWLRRHDRDDVLSVPQGDGEAAEYTYDQIEDRLDELEDQLAETIPKARKQVALRKDATAKAKKVYPKLFDRKSEAFQAMQKVLRSAPQLKALPDYQLMIGRMLAGEAAESAKPKKRATTPLPKPRAAKPPETSAPNKAKPSARTYGQVNAEAQTLGDYLGV